VTSGNPNEAMNFGLEEHVEHATRYRRAREFFDVVTGLWDSWADDAFVRDVEAGIYFNPEKLHILNHQGEFLRVRGPLNVARPIQGWPVIVQAGASEAGRQLAAETAEVIFAAGNNLAGARAFYADVKGRMEISGVVRRPKVGERGEQIAVGSYLILRHFPVCEDSQEGIDGVVSERPAIVREGCPVRGIIGQDLRQHCPCHPPCFRRRIPTSVLQRVREGGNETGIVRRLPGEIGISLRAGKTEDEEELQGPRTALRRNPARAAPCAGTTSGFAPLSAALDPRAPRNRSARVYSVVRLSHHPDGGRWLR